MPVITSRLTENEADTTTDTVVFAYTESTHGVFDYYRFTINADSDPVVKQRSEQDRKVQFTGLEAGTVYTVEAKTHSGAKFSTTQTVQILTGKCSILKVN